MQGDGMKYKEIVKPTNKDRITHILDTFFQIQGDYYIHEDGTVDIHGDCILLTEKYPQLPIKFGKIDGNFICQLMRLSTLAGAPEKVGQIFDCRGNRIKSLEGGPKIVGGDYMCNLNELTTLKGAPISVGGDFACNGNTLVSLDGIPEKIGGRIFIDWQPGLPLLKTLIAKKGIGVVNTAMSTHPVSDILNRCRKANPRNLRYAILDAQKALTDAGYAANARW
jgi:hypothetical protein